MSAGAATAFTESAERQELRKAVAALGAEFGGDYLQDCARNGRKTTELWDRAGQLGYLGVAIGEAYGGGGGDIGDLAAVCEELAAQGSPMLLMVVSPAICGTIIEKFGTEEQRQHWLPGFADGSTKMAFGITEPDAGSNSHELSTAVRRDGDDWILNGGKYYISGVDEASHVLVVARHTDAAGNRGLPSVFIVPTDAPGLTAQMIEMDIVSPEKQFTLFFDDVRLPADAIVGDPDAGLSQIFAGLNPERIMAASFATGLGRFALDKATDYARTRNVWGTPIGAHQGIAHPLAHAAISLELARVMTQKAAAMYTAGAKGAGEAANMAKYAAAEAACAVIDQAVQVHGGNGLAAEYGLGALLGASRVMRIAPVSREMILNYVSTHTLGLPRSY
ncbi:acyl-CoA dehydrogenase [Rhodococcus sp. X156]|uniref:acyl-CoA dehydrogenase family protein n=1 Tax=Rhodococcus sp. X156 TaxID=2499145 RepID=UPI000FD9B041|nr:acyl-CoA dehydrogenase [Rhodococcus sp. X156]